MKARWNLFLVPPLVISAVLLFVTQFVFLRASLHRDLGFGRISPELSFANYLAIFTDPFYLNTLALTIYVSAAVVIFTLVFGYPVAYVIARMRSRWASILMAAIVVTSFVTIVIKVLGLIIIFSAEGPLNGALRFLGLSNQPIKLVGNTAGVVIGLMHYTLGFIVLLLFGVIRTIPRSLEEAAQIHGASRWHVFSRVIFPLSLPGVLGGALIVFNLSMGAFTSAALLGGGRVLTLPVLIQRSISLETKYGMAAALSAVLLIFVLCVNLLSVALVSRLNNRRLSAP